MIGSPKRILAPGARRAGTAALFAILWFGPVAGAASPQQQSDREQRPPAISPSDLAKENFGEVAASAGDVKAALLKDPGLMVELRRWIATDATDHGQIIAESDMTEDAIFDRLENDVLFRSVATALLQRYGYLVPHLNPDSEAGKEQELLIQERVKWEVQREEQVRQQAEAKFETGLQKAQSCASGVQTDCPKQQLNLPAAGSRGQQLNVPNLGPSPNSPSTPIQRQDIEQLQQAQLIQADVKSGGDFSSLAGAGLLEMGGLTGAGSSSLLQMQGRGEGEEGGGLPSNGMSSLSIGSLIGPSAGSMLDETDLNPFDLSSPLIGTDTLVQPVGSGVNPNATVDQRSARTQPVEMVREPNPYEDIPSLYDMYMQAVPRPNAPRRFGRDIFDNVAQDPQLIPMDLPAGPEYVVGPGDGLAINLWGSVSHKLYRAVDREGRISLPEVGPVLVSGKSLADVQQNLQEVLRTQYRDESVDISLSRLRTIRVYEVGDLANPGAYDISSLSTPLNALFVAGGPTPQGSLRILKHYRGDQLVQEVDLYDLILHGVKSDINRLENGDTVLVPPIGPQVTLEGMVRRPAIYELKDEKNLAQVLELAGGLLPTATLRHIEVQRLVAHEKQTMLSLDIPDVANNADVTRKLEAFQVQDGDQVRIFPIASGNEDAIYLQGHVVRPGRYSYKKDMRVTDLIGSYKDLLPEPSMQYAEIIRLNAPDFHPTVESFDLADALADPSQAPILHPMDTVRIFSRFDFENPPTVSVLGDVRLPGTYRTSGQIHLSDAVHLAGGLAPDAQATDAQVFRYLPDGKLKIFSVNLSEALAGDPAENIPLETRDRLLIHRNADEADPVTVYVQGEVERPGRYPLTTNMTVGDLIRAGGGLTPSADTQNGDLTLYDETPGAKHAAQHQPILISAALSGDANSNAPLHNGDVVTIRQLPGWNDLGASITIKGEVVHPGTYGIHPGERLNSVLERAGGFQPDAYPYGAMLQRVQVRELETKSQDEMILRVKEAQSNLELLPSGTPQQQQAREMTLQQYQTTLTELTANPPLGRVSIRISANINRWRNTIADIDVRAGDTLIIPKKPSYIMITGQVYNPTAVSYRPGKSANWYLRQAGGPTQIANKKAIFVIRADGSVIGTSEGLFSGNSLDAVLLPGDTVVVPEKALGGGVQWANLFTTAQVASSLVSTVFIALHY